MTKKSILSKIQGLPENVFSENITLITVEKVYQAMDEYAEKAYNAGFIKGLQEDPVGYLEWSNEWKIKENDKAGN
jgi:hypothetical protein